MNNSADLLRQLIESIGMMAELQIITYNSFKNQKLSDEDAMRHTKALLSVMFHEMILNGKENPDDQN